MGTNAKTVNEKLGPTLHPLLQPAAASVARTMVADLISFWQVAFTVEEVEITVGQTGNGAAPAGTADRDAFKVEFVEDRSEVIGMVEEASDLVAT